MAGKQTVQEQIIEVGGVVYTMTRPGYYYKRENDKTTRIKKSEWEQAWEQSAGMQEREEKQKESDKEAEDTVNKKPKQVYKRKPKDQLTDKQVDFLKEATKTTFWENGVESTPWIDILNEEIGGQFAGKPFVVGAIISTLKEKGLIEVGKQRINGHMAKYFELTDAGKTVMEKLGLA